MSDMVDKELMRELKEAFKEEAEKAFILQGMYITSRYSRNPDPIKEAEVVSLDEYKERRNRRWNRK